MRWDPGALTATIYLERDLFPSFERLLRWTSNRRSVITFIQVTPFLLIRPPCIHLKILEKVPLHFGKLITCKGFGQLVQVSFDIAVFTLPAYQRGSLPRPSLEVSSWRWLRA